MISRDWIESELRRNATTQQILMRAAKALFENQHSMGFLFEKPQRDHYITIGDVDNVRRNLDKETWRRHEDDAISTVMWIRSNPSWVVLYHPPSIVPYLPLRLVVQRDMQLEWLLKWGNGACLAIDGTHGTQRYRVILLYPHFLVISYEE